MLHRTGKMYEFLQDRLDLVVKQMLVQDAASEKRRQLTIEGLDLAHEFTGVPFTLDGSETRKFELVRIGWHSEIENSGMHVTETRSGSCSSHFYRLAVDPFEDRVQDTWTAYGQWDRANPFVNFSATITTYRKLIDLLQTLCPFCFNGDMFDLQSILMESNRRESRLVILGFEAPPAAAVFDFLSTSFFVSTRNGRKAELSHAWIEDACKQRVQNPDSGSRRVFNCDNATVSAIELPLNATCLPVNWPI